MTKPTLETLEFSDEFIGRHIGPSDADIADMLSAIGAASLDNLIDKAVPDDIRAADPLMAPPMTEAQVLATIRELADRNKVLKSCIGMGYHGCHLPPVILRNLLDNRERSKRFRSASTLMDADQTPCSSSTSVVKSLWRRRNCNDALMFGSRNAEGPTRASLEKDASVASKQTSFTARPSPNRTISTHDGICVLPSPPKRGRAAPTKGGVMMDAASAAIFSRA